MVQDHKASFGSTILGLRKEVLTLAARESPAAALEHSTKDAVVGYQQATTVGTHVVSVEEKVVTRQTTTVSYSASQTVAGTDNTMVADLRKDEHGVKTGNSQATTSVPTEGSGFGDGVRVDGTNNFS